MIKIAIAVATKESTRFPGKNSLVVNGKPLIWHLEQRIADVALHFSESNEFAFNWPPYLISNEKAVLEQAGPDWMHYNDKPELDHQQIIHHWLADKADLILVLQVNVPIMPDDCLTRLIESYDPKFERHSIFEEFSAHIRVGGKLHPATLHKPTGAGDLWQPEALLKERPSLDWITVPFGSTLDIDYKWQTQSLSERLADAKNS